MLRHTVVLTWREKLGPDQLAQVRDALDGLGHAAPSVRSLWHGPDIGVYRDGCDYALVVDFDDLDGWRAYNELPEHDRVRAVLRPLTKQMSVVQFYVEESGVRR